MKHSENIDINNIEILNIDEDTSNKKINIKIILLILILLLIIIFGLGLYWFLSYAKNSVNSNALENKIVELGNEVNSDINYYFNKKNNCKLDISNVDSQKVGKYKYYVKCQNKEYSAIIEVKDTTAPKISLQIVNINLKDEFNAEQFIMSSYDLSKINFQFKDNININDYNSQNGLYLIPIKAIDEYNNAVIETGILLVSNVKAIKYLSATKIETTDYNATLKITDKIGCNSVNYYVNAIRIYDYTFNSNGEYKKVKEEYQNTNKINNIEGKVIFDDNLNNIKLVKVLNKQDLDLLNKSFPYTYEEIKSLYYSLGYNIQLEISK